MFFWFAFVFVYSISMLFLYWLYSLLRITIIEDFFWLIIHTLQNLPLLLLLVVGLYFYTKWIFNFLNSSFKRGRASTSDNLIDKEI
ncbi:MAG: hypothetical protein A3F91_09200 [Flavobacteria bacterium RIFCSPLOWO2_12_FULL_35_11]|nr:MAG: hypothetical protein A3F91_09200 [Flavobacteria bacterium RIFCSPLOWO2_12_FULL_35_11]